ncbi:MAG: hypothetical protein HGB12_02790 [Bacteroidetes bacterium]|nr:hypothetical protein [Bacteroidota bacterium]
MIEKDKAIRMTKNLIELKDSVLDAKFSKSHEKIAIGYKEHIIELVGGEEKYIKYLEIKIPVSKSEYKEIYNLFMDEFDKRKGDSALDKFHLLEKTIEQDMGLGKN